MGGKGQRRREKNYRASHGGEARLPPPPKLEELEAIPSKLRKIMELRNNPASINKLGHHPGGKDGIKEKKKGGTFEEKPKKADAKNSNFSPGDGSMTGEIQGAKSHQDTDDQPAVMNSSVNDKRKKRKRKAVDDLRFLELDQATCSSRKKKRKEYLEAKKKKQKKAKADDIPEFPGREKVQFGEVVQAPPKLSVPKALNVYHERVRVDIIEAYRKHKGWNSRPGIQVPLPQIAP